MKNWKVMTGYETVPAAECDADGCGVVRYAAVYKTVRKHNIRCTGKGVIAIVLLAGLLGIICYVPGAASLVQRNSDIRSYGGVSDIAFVDFSVPGYKEYMEAYEARYPKTEVRVEAGDCVRYEEKNVGMEPVFYRDYEGMDGISIYTGTDTLAEFEVTVDEEGFYNLEMEYYPLKGTGADIERRILIDGQLPYRELSRVRYDRIWRRGTEASDGIGKDTGGYCRGADEPGHDGNSGMMEITEWTVSKSYDGTGIVADPLAVYLTAGKHTIALGSVKEAMLIHQIILRNEKPVQEYAQVKAFWDAVGIKATSGQEVRIEAEHVAKTSFRTLHPVRNQTSSTVRRTGGNRNPDNCVDGEVWGEAGQWAEWEFDVEESGYYHITLYNCQNYVKEAGVCRKIMIDGVVPFAEMKDYHFTYGRNWREDVISDDTGTPYVFYLKQGHHRIRMEAVLGNLSDIVNDVREEVWQINEIYCHVMDAAGTEEENCEAGKLTETWPDLQEDIVIVRTKTDETINKLQTLTGRHSDGVKVLTAMRDALDELTRDVGHRNQNMRRVRESMYACSSWADGIMCQPLAIDCIRIVSADVDIGNG